MLARVKMSQPRIEGFATIPDLNKLIAHVLTKCNPFIILMPYPFVAPM